MATVAGKKPTGMRDLIWITKSILASGVGVKVLSEGRKVAEISFWGSRGNTVLTFIHLLPQEFCLLQEQNRGSSLHPEWL